MAGFMSGAMNMFGGSKKDKKESGGGGGGMFDMLSGAQGGGDGGMFDMFSDITKNTGRDGSVNVSDVTGTLQKHGFKENDSQITDIIKGMVSSGGSSGGDSKMDAGGIKSLMSKIPPSLYKDAALRKVFRQFDKDGNGTIDRSELSQVLSKLGKTLSEEQTDKAMSVLDTDKSGTIEYEELIARINSITG